MCDISNDVASIVLETFRCLPNRAKPRQYPDGSREWTTLSGIVLSRPSKDAPLLLQCVALGTGSRCLPLSKLHLAQGNTLHDWHAEIVAIRAFNLFLLQECQSIVRPMTTEGSGPSEPKAKYIRHRTDEERTQDGSQPFAICDDVKIHMYSSTAPCGDASMELTMASQADATPWPVSGASTDPRSSTEGKEILDGSLPPTGRSNFSLLGIVRRKPARADAPSTLSKSCSDKLAMMQCVSLLSGLTNLLIHPGNAYLDTLVLPREEYVPSAVDRAFGVGGRMASVAASASKRSDARSRLQEQRAVHKIQDLWREGYTFRPFSVVQTTHAFEYARNGIPSQNKPLSGSNITAAWTTHMPYDQPEILINGTRSGHKQFAPRGASVLSRRGVWRVVVDIAAAMALTMPAMQSILQRRTYAEVKASDALEARRGVKRFVREHALHGWAKNDGDDQWSLEAQNSNALRRGRTIEE